MFCPKSDKNFQSKIFESAPRTFKWDNSNVLKCLRGNFDDKKISVIQSRESTWFSTNALVLLGNISIPTTFNSTGKHIEMKFTMNIIEYEEHTFGMSGANKVLFSGTVECISDKEYGSVSLTRPIIINPKKLYEVRFETTKTSIEVHHVWTWYSEVKLGTLVVKFHKNPSDENNQSGLVRQLTFNRIPK